MKLHLEELALSRERGRLADFEPLSPGQIRTITNRGRELHKWFKADPRLHALINSLAILSIFSVDWLALTKLPALFLAPPSGPVWVIAAASIVGVIHGWILYSIAIFSLHEGAAHHLIFPGKDRFSRVAHLLSTNMSRLSGAEPEYYSGCHMAHHAKFGTEHDSEFLNFVVPRRFWRTFLPLAAFINFSDFLIHRPLSYTRSRVISEILMTLYVVAYCYAAYRFWGLLFAGVLLLLLSHIGFYFDRLRQFTEHNLMPLDNANGARSFGAGFWGLLIGGGPWGQPCHLVHHIVPSIPWYQQLVLHRYMARLLTRKQQSQFLLQPVLGFPRLLWQIVRDANAFSRRVGNDQRAEGAHAGD